jgi:hypothetical protein
MPLERLFDYCGEQMAFYCGKDLGDLIVITLNKYATPTFSMCFDAALSADKLIMQYGRGHTSHNSVDQESVSHLTCMKRFVRTIIT